MLNPKDACQIQTFFLWTDAPAVNPNGIKTLLANGLSAFPTKGNPAFSIGHKTVPKCTPNCPVLSYLVFYNFISAYELFVKALQSYENYLLVNNNPCRKLFLLLDSPTTFKKMCKVTSVPFFIAHFNLLSFELVNLTFKVLY